MNRQRSISSEEKSLWDKVMENVSPSTSNNQDSIEYDGVENTKEKVFINSPKTALRKAKKYNLSEKIPANTKPYVDVEVGVNAGLDKRNAQRLKRGKLRPEARIDLHGYMQYEAYW